MAKITPMRVTEQFEHFVQDLKERFLGRRIRADTISVEALLGGRVDA
jgi:hypothetical protein